MRFTVISGTDEKVVYRKAPVGYSLGHIFKDADHIIQVCAINNEFDENWRNHVIRKKDDIKIYCKYGYGLEIIIYIVVAVALSVISMLLQPSPQKPSAAKNQPAFGIAGIQNTVAPGTPKFLPYGIRRVFGHIIGSQCELIDPPKKFRKKRIRQRVGQAFGTKMKFAALYFMGKGPILDITSVQINGTNISDIEAGEPTPTIRLGTDDQDIIEGWEQVHQTYTDGRAMDARNREAKREREARSLIYTTQGSEVSKVTIFYQFPQGLWANNTGIPNGQSYTVLVEVKEHDVECDWTEVARFKTPRTSTQRAFFWSNTMEMPHAAKWDIRLTVVKQDSYRKAVAGFNVYNVQETSYIRTTYPGSALLDIKGIASDQINSFDNMKGSAIVCGRFVDVLVEGGVYVKQFSRNRVWIVRDLLYNEEVGLGNRLDSSMWDDAAGAEAAAYYEEMIDGFDGLEQRDYCDLIINEQRSGSDHIKTLLFEGQAAIIPSQGKMKYMIDKDRLPNLLYATPGNIIENSLQYIRGSAEKSVNTIRIEYPDATKDFKVIPGKYPESVDEPEKAETISLTSVTRESQASRLAQFRLNYLTLIKERWQWKSPPDACVSEPYDVDKLAYQVSDGLRGFTGLIANSASTSSSIYTGKQIYLASGFTYSAHVRQGQTIEERNVTNASGNTWSIFSLSSPLSFTPELGDIWAIGKVNQYVREVQFDEIEFDGETYILKCHVHVPEIYDTQLSRITTLEHAVAITPSVIPLLSAQALTQGIFTVVPGFDILAGTISAITGGTQVFLHSKEPGLDDWFNNASITISGQSFTIEDYVGSTRRADIDDTTGFSGVAAGATYEIFFPNALSFYGFRVEGSSTINGPFTVTGITPSSVAGTSFTTTTSPPAYSYYRFTPFDQNEEDNTLGRWVVATGRTDTTAPTPPMLVQISSNEEREVHTNVTLFAPLDRDAQYLECEYAQGSPTAVGLTVAKVLTDISDLRDEGTTDESQVVSVTSDLSSLDFGSNVYTRATVIDFYGNRSETAIAFVGTTLSSVEVDESTEDILETINAAINFTGSTATYTVYSTSVDGGSISQGNTIEANVFLQLTQVVGVSTTTLTFGFNYGSASTATIPVSISNNTSALATNTAFWLNFRVKGNSPTSQTLTASKFSDTISAVDVLTTVTAAGSVNSDIGQTLSMTMALSGLTNTIITRKYSELSIL